MSAGRQDIQAGRPKPVPQNVSCYKAYLDASVSDDELPEDGVSDEGIAQLRLALKFSEYNVLRVPRSDLVLYRPAYQDGGSTEY